MKKKILLLLLLAMCALLTACGGKEDIPNQTVYIPEDVEFTTGLQFIHDGCTVGGTVYLLGKKDSTDRDYTIVRVTAEGGEAEALPDYQPAVASGDSLTYNSTLRAGVDGTLWEMKRLEVGTINEDGTGVAYEYVHVLRNLDKDGKELARFEYPSLEENLGLGVVYDLLADGDGDVFASAEEGAALLDEDGNARFIIKKDSAAMTGGGGLVLLGDGRVGMLRAIEDAPGEYTRSLCIFDKETKGFGEAAFPLADGTPMPLSAYDGDEQSLFYYKTGDTLWAWREDAGEGELLTNLIDAGIASTGLNVVSLLSDGRLVLQSGRGYMESDPASLDILRAADASTSGRKTLNYATLQLAGKHRDAIMAFNSSSTEYRISVTDYSQYGDREAAMTRLATEIGSGKMPDILDTQGIPVRRWAANGYFEDLWPYIDSDPELGRDALMERVFQTAEIDGKLYEVGQYFWMWTLTGLKDVVGDRMSWTGGDMWEALKSMPEGCVPVAWNRNRMLSELTRLSAPRFVDYENAACDFTGDEFKSILKFCAGFPEESKYLGEQGIYEGREMLISQAATGFDFPQKAKFLLGGDISYVGCPNERGEAGSSFALIGSMAMSSACKDKDGAWSFLRTLLLPHGEDEPGTYNYFPVNRADFEMAAELAMAPEYETRQDGGKVEVWKDIESFTGIPEDCLYYAATREEYGQLMALYDAIGSYSRWDPDLEQIITDTAGAYFAGDRSLDDTVALVQNRVELYLGEQK